MAKPKNEMARRQTNALTGDEAEKLFETVDETGHSNEEVARRERSRRKEKYQYRLFLFIVVFLNFQKDTMFIHHLKYKKDNEIISKT